MFSPFVAGLGPEELVLILIVVVVLFGAKKLPDLARGSGQALRIFKSEMKGFNDDDETTAASVATPEQLEIQKLKADIAAEQAKSAPASETVAAAIKTPEQLEIEQLKAQLAAAQRIEHDAAS